MPIKMQTPTAWEAERAVANLIASHERLNTVVNEQHGQIDRLIDRLTEAAVTILETKDAKRTAEADAAGVRAALKRVSTERDALRNNVHLLHGTIRDLMDRLQEDARAVTRRFTDTLVSATEASVETCYDIRSDGLTITAIIPSLTLKMSKLDGLLTPTHIAVRADDLATKLAQKFAENINEQLSAQIN